MIDGERTPYPKATPKKSDTPEKPEPRDVPFPTPTEVFVLALLVVASALFGLLYVYPKMNKLNDEIAKMSAVEPYTSYRSGRKVFDSLEALKRKHNLYLVVVAASTVGLVGGIGAAAWAWRASDSPDSRRPPS